MLRTAAVSLSLGAIASPLVLNAIALDLHRWHAQAALNAGLAALMLMQATPATV